ncbi:MAG: PIN domain-containing protein [Acidobacteriota bacterium]|nr:PIN domain-containing protein [Acidobacteriota bacterium]
MKTAILLDTGPLVAYFYRRDENHQWAREQIGRLPVPLLICEPVLTETFFLLYRLIGSGDPAFEFIQTGAARLSFNLSDELDAIKNLMTHYANVPMSLADACLVRMSELYSDSLVLTNDSDFNIYRRRRNQTIPTLMPSA